ncbi:MAG: glycosyltransferase [Lachnospiraceae bacterium]|nr:glycosyltransferase [Lachnospiraceae bacterium]
MKKNIIIFGIGHYGQKAYWKLKNEYHIISFADNNSDVQGTFYEGVPVISGEELRNLDLSDTDIVICTRAYYQIGSQISDMGISSYYVMLEGFLYHTDLKETMMPVEICRAPYHRKKDGEKNILFIQNAACIRTYKIARVMREEGYHVYLLYTLAPPYAAYEEFADIFEDIWGFSSANGIVDFISNSDFDIVHCSNEPDILVNIVQKTNKPVVADTHDMQSIRGDIGIDALNLEYLANTGSDGVIYVSTYIAEIAKDKYKLDNKEVFVVNNLVMEQVMLSRTLPKLSLSDHEIHCVYEGGVVGDDKENHRFFDNMWKKIADAGVHIHFYSPSNIAYCKRLENISGLIHYEGSVSGERLIREMTKYDCGLALFNSVDNNRFHLEGASPNKVYEYISARLPVATAGIKSLKEFVEGYHVGMALDFSKDIRQQLEEVRKLQIDKDFLTKNKLTMKSYGKELAAFYERVKLSYGVLQNN